MIPYFLFLITILLLYWSKKPVWLAVVITVFAVIRFDTGWDYDSYYQVCTDSTRLDIAKTAWGWLWGVWFEFCYDHRIPFVGIGVPAILTTAILYRALSLLYGNDKRKMADGLLVYSIWPFLYLQSFCIVRQSLAISIMFWAFVLFAQKKYVLPILLTVLNFFIHPSSVFSVLFIFFIISPKRLSLGFVILVGVLSLLTFQFLGTVLESLGMFKYLDLLESSDTFGGKIALLYAVLAIYYLFFLSVNKDTSSVYSKMVPLMALGCLLQFLVYVTDVPSVISRACSYTYIFLIPTIFYSFEQLKIRTRSLFIVLSCLLFLVYLYITQDSEGAVSQYVPYKTIFSQL